MTDRTRGKSRFHNSQRASTLAPGSSEQVRLAMDRISRGVCLECGGKRNNGGNFCAACLVGYPKEIDVAEPFGGWRYCLRQKGPAIPGLSLFEAVRIGIYEYKGRQQLIAICDSLEKARAAALKMQERSIRTSGYYG